MLNRLSLLLISFLLTLYSQGQEKYSEYLFPIKPGQKNGLAGTVGELRTTHFHTGLDIKTDGVVGLPVHASMDGYISRILMGPSGYGLALYIQHPNGFTTVYGHLLKFNDEIAEYVLAQQYRRKSFRVNLYPPKSMFPVKRGDIIALAGNSGSSSGPHLHWDIRDPYQRPVSSLLDRFKEIEDNIPPQIYKVAFTSLDENGRINGLYGRYEFNVLRVGDTYKLRDPVAIDGNVGMEILGFDKLNGYPNRCGISRFTMEHNGEPIFESRLYRLSFSKQRSIYKYYNYPERVKSGDRYHSLYIDEGNDLDFYPYPELNGVISAEIQKVDTLSGTLYDPYGNLVHFEFATKATQMNQFAVSSAPELEIRDNFLQVKVIKASNEEAPELSVWKKGIESKKSAYYSSEKYALYLIDLRENLADSLGAFGRTIQTGLVHLIPSGTDYTFYSDMFDLRVSKEDLFDTLYLKANYSKVQNDEFFTVGTTDIPLRKSISITLKPKNTYDGDKWSVYSVDERGRLYYQGGIWKDGKVSFSTSYFNQFTIAKDDSPPTIHPTRISKSELSFRISDKLSGIDDYQLYVDGEWILMHYDPKSARIWTELPKGMVTLSGEVLLKVTDNEGNEAVYKTSL